jgi:hypothetical protein
MHRRISRRTLFFAVLMVLGLAMVPVTPPAYEGAAWFVVAASAFWAALFLLEDLLTPVWPGGGADGAPHPEPPIDAVFAPPPSPRSTPSERQEEAVLGPAREGPD